MLLYDYQVGDQFQQVRELADRFREKFQTGASPEELLLDRRVLEGAYDQLDRLLPEAVGRGHLGRHLYWIEYWLNQNEPERCSGDLESICIIDLPRLEQGFRQWCASRDHYDRQFADEIAPLLRDRHLDSAVRRAFVILKQRLVDLFGLPTALDGSQLVNEIFGTQGRLAGRVPREEQQALRNLLDGLYGVFRNTYGHQNVEPDWYEVEAILSMVNWALKYVERFRSS